MKFLYGIQNNYIDITDVVYNKCIINNKIHIPRNDLARASIFGDPLIQVVKHIVLEDDYGKKIFTINDEINIPLDKEIKTKYDIIFLIISSKNNNYYQEMKRLTSMYMSKYSYNINFFFIEADPNIKSQMEVIGNNIFVKDKETYTPGIFIKTIKALKYINDNYNYDYLIRTNSSSFFNIENMLKYLSNLPKEKYAIGFTLNLPKYGNFLHGTSTIITKDISHYLYQYYNNFDLKIADDVLMSLILKSQNITLNVLDETKIQFLINNIYDESQPKLLIEDNILYYRVKNDNNGNRDVDIMYFKFLLNKIYNVF
jgi:hypothetical protein